MTFRLLGVQIANGYSPEARVFARLLGWRGDAYEARVLHHAGPGAADAPARFEQEAQAPVGCFDTGWRPGVPGRRLPFARIASHARFRATLPALLQAARRFQPDVIYSCQQHWDCFAATYIARRLGKPQVIHLHYTVGEYLRRPVLKRLLTTDHVVTVSDFIRGEALRHGVRPERVTTILNTLQPSEAPPTERAAVRAELGIPADAPVIGIVARIDPGKGQEDTLAAFANAATSRPDARLIVVGDGALRPELEARAAQTSAAGRILFTGQRSDVPRLLGALDIFAHPSRYDACPLALLEAASAGLPVVAYAEGGARELVKDGVTGLLAAPGDVDALASCLARLLDDPAEARQMGGAGRFRIGSDFRPETAASAFSDLARRVAAGPGNGAALLMKNAVFFSLAGGGICHYTYCLADALQCQGISAQVLMYDSPAYELQALPHIHTPSPLIRMSHTRAARLVDPLLNLRALVRAARRSDVVHYQWAAGPRTDPWQWRAVQRLGRPVVYTAHDVKPHESDIISREHNLWLYRTADALIVHGQRLRDTLLEMADVAPEKVHVAPLGNFNFVADGYAKWDRERARASFGFSEDEQVVLFFGMIRPYKGLDTLIDACGLVKERRRGGGRCLRLLIAGKPLKDYWNDGGYAAQIARAGLAEQTRCAIEHVEMEDVGRYFHAADVVAVPYKSGSQSGVLQLAYAFSKPVIVTDVGSFTEVVQDGRTGLIVPPDDPAAFAEALAQLLDDPDRAACLGRYGRIFAETELGWDRIATQTRSIYEKVIRGTG